MVAYRGLRSGNNLSLYRRAPAIPESFLTPFFLLPALVILTQMAFGFAGAVVAQTPKAAKAAPPPVYVVHISVDGLRPAFLQQLISAGQAPNFAKLTAEGAWTFNARTDYDITVTLPNHVSMLTGRPIYNKYGLSNSGHRWTLNSTPNLRWSQKASMLCTISPPAKASTANKADSRSTTRRAGSPTRSPAI